MQRYSPSQVAEMTGFSLDTLRYYDKIGLLDELARTPGGQRIFTEVDVAWLGILRCLRDTGMPIAQMQRYAHLARAGDETLAERITVLEEHDQAVEEQIARLRAQQSHIRDKIAYYRSEIAAQQPAPSAAPTA
ncbi:MerR family transcriptional regulator [Cryptosporangium aurantiacum]|uniref:DNA-binding transcriptional regulator, MerR family n=1 Tax=Cryptosporangium aurantiacum TaxID=134849 RepID=A0A1M7QY31_9ACTN|nr:MerR family transcriptional regulator [Cryptosporangium aurantiacum]SHN37036.1 DNA-binding transcriptional regulator, MerR family [Cryptosporangium aurantiacum]